MLDNSCKLCTKQTIHTNCQTLFSLKKKKKTTTLFSLKKKKPQIYFGMSYTVLAIGALRDNCKTVVHILGTRCEIYDYCAEEPCHRHGKCVLKPTQGYTCDCMTGDPNRDCALNDIDMCTQHPPAGYKNYISCIDLIGL